MPGDNKSAANEAQWQSLRRTMVERQLRARDIGDPRVLTAMERTPRHEFVPADARDASYEDRPLPIGGGQTISQPYVVALMTQLVGARPTGRALDVGCGSGYQAAVLAGLYAEVYSVEIQAPLAEAARRRLERLGYGNVAVRHGDGYQGWPERAPFDAIVVAAAPDHVPPALVEQLAPGGRLVLPVGAASQLLRLIEKRPNGSIAERDVTSVVFVPMTGGAQTRR